MDVHPFQVFALTAIDLVWANRNKLVHGSPSLAAIPLARQIIVSSQEHGAAWHSLVSVAPGAHWSPPPPGWFKVNFDAAIRPSGYAVECVCRDSDGAILGASVALGVATDPVVGEARGAVLGLQTAIDLRLASVILEVDSALVVDALQCSRAPCPWLISMDVCNARVLIDSLQACKVVFSPRSANSLSHDLARWAASSSFEGCLSPSLELLCNYP